MITKEEAYEIAKANANGRILDGICVDYKDSWAFPYATEGDTPFGDRIFILKDDGLVVENDPAFNIELWIKSKSYEME